MLTIEIVGQVAMETKAAEYERQQFELNKTMKEKGSGGMSTAAGKHCAHPRPLVPQHSIHNPQHSTVNPQP